LHERNEAKEQERKVLSRQDAVASEIELMHHLASSTDAFPESVAWLIEKHKGNFALLSPVSELIQTEEEYAVALEAALGEAQNYVVVETFRDAERASDLLKKQKKGQATFIPLDWISGDDSGSARTIVEGGTASRINPIMERIQTEERYRSVAELLLGHIYLAEELGSDEVAGSGFTDEYRALLTNHRGAAIVTTSGELFTYGGLFKSGSKSHQSGLRLGLKNKLEKLEKSGRSLQKDLDTTRRSLEKIEQQLRELHEQQIREEITTLQKERREKDQTVGKLQSGIQIYERSILEQQAHRERLSLSEGQSRQELEELKPGLERIDGEIAELREKEETTKASLQKLEDERAIAQNRYNDAQLAHQDISNRTANIEQQLQRADEGTERISGRLKQRGILLEQSRENIRQYREESEQIAGLMVGLTESLEKARLALENAEKESKAEREQIQQQDKELRTLRKDREDQLELLHHLTMAAEKFDLQLESITNSVWETYNLTMEQLLNLQGEGDLRDAEKNSEDAGDEKDRFDVDAAKERVSVLRQKLHRIGEVNPLAIEEYQEEKERLDFYEQQMEDLRKAELEMRDTIAEINETATERFNDTFELIRSHFQDVFHRLFEEDDYCDLVLDSDSEDPLEAKVEIRANPKGKRPSNISQLSGGEKT
ncbi:MAG: chromosome segregation protein SMC, partial [Balneolaceae bacterium]